MAIVSVILHYLSPPSAAADRLPDTTALAIDGSIAKSNQRLSWLAVSKVARGYASTSRVLGLLPLIAAPPSTEL